MNDLSPLCQCLHNYNFEEVFIATKYSNILYGRFKLLQFINSAFFE